MTRKSLDSPLPLPVVGGEDYEQKANGEGRRRRIRRVAEGRFARRVAFLSPSVRVQDWGQALPFSSFVSSFWPGIRVV